MINSPIRTLSRAVTHAGVASLIFAVSAQAQVPAGRWVARLVTDSLALTFPIEFSGDREHPVVSFLNGDIRVSSTSAQWNGDTLVAHFDHLISRLHAVLGDSVLRGTYGNVRRPAHRTFEARPETPIATTVQDAPDIDGVWHLPHDSPKGEKAWRLVVRQEGPNATATILRVDGDAGAHIGRFDNDRFLLDHFDGARASQLEVIPAGDSVLVHQRGARGGTRTFIGHRPDAAGARGLPDPADFTAHTGVKDPDEPFEFSFPDLNGTIVSNTDARFVGKVVLVNIGGSWCPNCHDEAPFLTDLFRVYRERGLEIVLIDFEDTDELAYPRRLPAFIERYGIEYTVLLAGHTDELDSKIPQATNLNAWPTTFILGRDGTVRAVHAGFPARASGDFHERTRQDYIATIERLLAEKPARAAN